MAQRRAGAPCAKLRGGRLCDGSGAAPPSAHHASHGFATGRNLKEGPTGSAPQVLRVIERTPEEIIDHINHLTAVSIDEDRVVVIANPAIAVVGGGQSILPRIVYPVAAAVEQRSQAEADAEPRIAMVAVRRIIGTQAIATAVLLAIVAPVVAAVVTPRTVPVAPAVVVAAIDAVVVVPVVTPIDLAVAIAVIPRVAPVKSIIVVAIEAAVEVAVAIAVETPVDATIVVTIITPIDLAIAVAVPLAVDAAVVVAIISAAALALCLLSLSLSLSGLALRGLLPLRCAARLLPLLTLRLALLVIAALLLTGFAALLLTGFAALLAHFVRLLALGARRSLLALDARLAPAVAAAYFRAAWSTITAVCAIAVAALRQLQALARRLRGGRGNWGEDRRSDQQPSKNLFHLAILQLMSR